MSIEAQGVYREHDPGDARKLYPGQLEILNIAQLIDQLCRKYDIQYTLLFSTLVGAIEYGGYCNNATCFQMGMLYPEFIKFKNIFQREYRDSEYYLLDHTNLEDFTSLEILIKKRGTTELPTNRKKDEIYYDAEVVIMPIFYLADSKAEQEYFHEKASYLIRCAKVQAYERKNVSLKSYLKFHKKWRLRNQLLKDRSGNDFNVFRQMLEDKSSVAKTYVYLPYVHDQEGCVCLAETYKNLEEVSFEGYRFFCMKNARQWIETFYEKKEITSQLNLTFNLYEAYGKDILRKIQLMQVELLQELDRICRANDITYYISFGTALGAVRHGGFIPWDDDADIIMMWSDYQKFCMVIEKELNWSRFFWKTPHTDKNCNFVFGTLRMNGTKSLRASRQNVDTHYGVKIDVFPIFSVGNNHLVNYMKEKICKWLKTVVWAHLGAKEEMCFWKRKYYSLLSKFDHIKAYDLFLKVASSYKAEDVNNLMFPYVHTRYLPGYGVVNKMYYEETVDVDFEGLSLMASKYYKDILYKIYGSDCIKRLPDYGARKPKHLELDMLDLGGGNEANYE